MKRHIGRRLIIGIAFALVAVLLLTSLMLGGHGYHIDWWTIDGGGASEVVSGDGAYTLSGTIGQPDAGLLESADGSYTLSGGFWGGGAAPGYDLYLPAVNNQ